MDRLRLKQHRYGRRKLRVKRKIKANAGVLRLCISKSNRNIFAQIIDDVKGHTVVAASTMEKAFEGTKNLGNKQAATALGKHIAEKAKQQGIEKVVFDRNGYLYHGRVKAFADAAREAGLQF